MTTGNGNLEPTAAHPIQDVDGLWATDVMDGTPVFLVQFRHRQDKDGVPQWLPCSLPEPVAMKLARLLGEAFDLP